MITDAQPERVIFTARQVIKTYGAGEVEMRALRGVNLDLYEREFVVILGPSGSGKSTLMNILGALDVPTGGTVHYRGRELTACGDTALTSYRREHVGFVFQFYNLVPSLTARENVELITEIAPNPMNAEEALRLVGLQERIDDYPSQMSGEEQQRVAIARAIAKRPDVLLCDEPTGALEGSAGVLVLEALDRINRELGLTTVVITHNAVIARMADRVIALSHGLIAAIHRNERKVPPTELPWR